MILNEKCVAVVTGGAKGIGLGIIEEFSLRNVKCVCIDIDDVSGQTLAATHSNIFYYHCDCSLMENICSVMDEVLEKFGRVDILVNNVGAFVESSFIKDSFYEGLAKFDSMLTLCAKTTYAFSLKVAKAMKDVCRGEIVNIITNHVHRDVCRVSSSEHSYDAAKYAQLSLNMSMAAELSQYGIFVNAIDPASTMSNMLVQYFKDRGIEANESNIKAITGFASLMMPRDVGRAVVNLVTWEEGKPNGINFLVRTPNDCDNIGKSI